ncbi:DUF3987 domain-containing protein [Streptomyces yunnanensis]|uniref:DUF3987 domain-containing protein n=1 Tax=Streptomyces yunnanensis TaxID=156453 RepID=A0A9X8QZN3_9ACTN|nr:DUF3987 domain-containing protein [Streptomyces yunnanensis]SHN24921.1 Protein of unknown function [Streptomyces yunnanensis]
MPDKRSTETVRRNLDKEVPGIGRPGAIVNLNDLETFTSDVEGWLQANTEISEKTIKNADYPALLQEWREKRSWSASVETDGQTELEIQTEPEEQMVLGEVPEVEETPEADKETEAGVENEIDKAVHREMEDEVREELDQLQAELDDLPYAVPVPGPKGRPWLGKDAWHGIAGEILEYVSPDTEGDPAGILATMLSSFSCLVGHDRIVRGSVKQRVNVWHILIGETGDGRKGTAADRALEVMERVNPRFFEKNTTSTLNSGEGLISSVRDGMDEEEIARREENGQRVDYGVDDKRLLVMSTEFATIMQKTHGSTLGPVLRDAWDGKTLNNHSTDALVATKPHITVMGHVTGQEFSDRQKPSEMAGGTWNRFAPIFVHKPHDISWPVEPEDWDTKLDHFADRLREAAFKAGGNDSVVTFSKEAELHYRRNVYPEFKDSDDDSPVMKQFTQRRLAHLVRVAGVYALMNEREEVSIGDLKAAKAFVDYMIESARFVLETYPPSGSGSTAGGGRDRSKNISLPEDTEMLGHALKEAGESGLNRTHITTKVMKFRRSAAEIDGMIEKLKAVQKKRHNPRGGRPLDVVYHPEFAPKEIEEA